MLLLTMKINQKVPGHIDLFTHEQKILLSFYMPEASYRACANVEQKKLYSCAGISNETRLPWLGSTLT
jgi:hypothetical protein